MNDNDIIKAMDICAKLEFLCGQRAGRELWFQKPVDVQDEDIRQFVRDVAFLWHIISQQEAEIETLKAMLDAAERYLHPLPFKDDFDEAIDKARVEVINGFADRIGKLLGRYAHIHKYADEARHSTEEYPDGTPMEMVSVWEVLRLNNWEMVDCETMNQLQENIETIAKERMLSELEKDFSLLVKEMKEGQHDRTHCFAGKRDPTA